MKPSLQLGLGQQLTLTPQLQQAIRFLQLSTLELQSEIEQALQQNPLLESSVVGEKDAVEIASMETSQHLDTFQWETLYSGKNRHSYRYEDDSKNIESSLETSCSLQDHLRWQLDLTPMSDIDRVIALTLIDAVNDDGLLTQTIIEIYESLNTADEPLGLEEVETVQHRLQYFDPVGCVSQNLKEVLLVQLEVLPLTEIVKLAKELVRSHLSLLAQHNYRQLMKLYHVSEAQLSDALQIIQTLHPKPGTLITANRTEYIMPDVIVKKVEGQWVVFLNQHTLPKININQQYAAMISRDNSSADNQFLKDSLQEARWFLKSIESRQETLLKVAQCVMERQKGFLEGGEVAMQPLILNDIAALLSLHESTISRVTTNKYIHTPRGVFELKYFFSSHVGMENGGECSSTAIRAMIRKLIKEENPMKPLSDSKMVDLIQKKGIQIARRTVAKYREAMGVLPSHERKIMGQLVKGGR